MRVPHLQTSLAVWTLSLDSELIFVGDAGTTEAGRPSHRYGIEWANYYSPKPWLIFDADVSISRAHFTDDDPVGDFVPGAVATVVSAGATVDSVRNIFGSVRWRYFGPRPLLEDNSRRSDATSLVNLEAGYKLTNSIRIAAGRVQPVQRQAQRHRLLLHLTAARRAVRRRGRHPLPPDAPANRARQRHCWVLVGARDSGLGDSGLRRLGATCDWTDDCRLTTADSPQLSSPSFNPKRSAIL